MPSFADSFGLGAITAWLSGSSKSESDVGRSSVDSTKPKTPSRMQKITISRDLIKGKTFEEAMAAVMAGMPPSTTDSEEADGLADEFAVTSLSENASSGADTVGHSYPQHEHEEEAPATKAAFETSSDMPPGCQCCDWAFQTEYAFRKVMQASQALGPGSTDYYE